MRVAVVNDLALAREVLRRVILSVPEHTVAWTAEDGAEAVRKALADPPDVILMDLIMPQVNGVEATRQIMASRPCPILLVTSSVAANYALVCEAMGHGGLDAVNTPSFGPKGEILGGASLLARLAKLQQATLEEVQPSAERVNCAWHGGQRHVSNLPLVIAIGASTGGPDALGQILATFPATLRAAVLIVQHIGADFAPALVQWLRGRAHLPVRLAVQGEAPQPGVILIAGTNDHLALGADRRLLYTPDPEKCPYRPSVNVLFDSLAEDWPRQGVGVLLTGMGGDGANGLVHLRRCGWHTIAQDAATSIVYGMPRVAAQLKAARQILPLGEIGPAILHHLHTHPQSSGS